MGRRPAGHAPPAVPARASHGVAADDAQGPHPGDPDRRRLRAADRPHQRRPGGRRACPTRWPARSGSPTSRPSRPDRPAARQARRLRAASATRSAVRAALADAGRRPVGDYDTVLLHRRRARAGSGRSTGATPDDRHGRRPRGGRRGPDRGGRCRAVARTAVVRGAAGGAPLRGGRPTTSSSSPTPGPRAPGPDGSATSTRRRSASSPHRSRRRCRRPPAACCVGGDPDRRRTDGWRCAAGRATSCSTGRSRSGADVYVTSDLRHHPAAEFLEQGGPALVDVAHWAAEWTWLPELAARLREALGDTVEIRVSTLCTDPWTFRH